MSFQQQYRKEIQPALMKELKIKNPMAVPKVIKVTLNIGVGSIINRTGEKKTERFEENLAKISGQKPIVKITNKSISNFKLRAGMPVGVTVTLRKKKMWDFLERLILIAIPRIRDFRGFARKGDGQGNLSLGIFEHNIFPEVGEEDATRLHGLEVSISTTAKNDQEMFALMDKFKFPFKKS